MLLRMLQYFYHHRQSRASNIFVRRACAGRGGGVWCVQVPRRVVRASPRCVAARDLGVLLFAFCGVFTRSLRRFTACASILAVFYPARRAQAPPWMQMATDWRWKPRPPHNLNKMLIFTIVRPRLLKSLRFFQLPLSCHSVATQ